MLESMALAGSPGRWPASLVEDASLRGQVEVMLRAQPEDVRAALLERLSDRDPRGPLWARTALQAIGVANTQGGRLSGVLVPGLFRVEIGRQSYVLAPIAFQLAEHGSAAADLAALRAALDGALRGRYYTLRLKRPLAPGADVAHVAVAVHLWLQAVDRGEDVGHCASYEDTHVAIELCLTPPAGLKGSGGLVMVVHPSRSLEVLSQIDARLMYIATLAGEVAPGVPVLPALGCGELWRLPRGFVNQILFGAPREVLTFREDDAHQHQALYRSNGLSLFSDPLSSQLAGLWWCDAHGAGLNTTVSFVENPWSKIGSSLPPFAGRSFLRREGPAGSRGEVIMGWNGQPPQSWSPSR